MLSSEAGAEEGAFEGFVDVASILRHVLATLEPHGLLSERACSTAEDTVEVMASLTRLAPAALDAPVSTVSRSDGDLVYRGFSSCTLFDIVSAAFVHPFHLRDVSVCHRVAAADVRPDLDSAASLRNVDARSLTIVSQFDLVRRVMRMHCSLPCTPSSEHRCGAGSCMSTWTSWGRWRTPRWRRSA